jgi:hypothetical protein
LHRERLIRRQPQPEGQHALRFRPAPTIVTSPMISGSSDAAAQATTICGSDRSRACARSISAVSEEICSRKKASASRRAAGADQQHRVHHREAQDAQRQAERGEFMPLELREGGNIEVEGGEFVAPACVQNNGHSRIRPARNPLRCGLALRLPLASIMPAFHCPKSLDRPTAASARVTARSPADCRIGQRII